MRSPEPSDAIETIEELYYLVLATASEEQIRVALDQFYRFERGEEEPTGDSVFAKSYRQTQAAMDPDFSQIDE